MSVWSRPVNSTRAAATQTQRRMEPPAAPLLRPQKAPPLPLESLATLPPPVVPNISSSAFKWSACKSVDASDSTPSLVEKVLTSLREGQLHLEGLVADALVPQPCPDAP
mmetsp:Transcript_25984/g.55289  ORF Transcript_25984/g.55289 Transcript_25984/m.55289 type:complete len:109 (-) Transcript_25984:371-697(-)|eukprot:CAMPEP_0206437680 /NCGR_PEP_ID=MMETSP0324_2-20121206/11181_1 /ASSEMBLY_ACC=CAM_ASM_000836 /TAXON_ID=2866 /ORGANISM="Crypthecodinium cohnii, Strain Seligo" /LENGTH=108 /DNA_ID=CAMNT_0053904999 /DNA_START=173 /DNA_END=499 /DNA_ORIENTATION=+